MVAHSLRFLAQLGLPPGKARLRRPIAAFLLGLDESCTADY